MEASGCTKEIGGNYSVKTELFKKILKGSEGLKSAKLEGGVFKKELHISDKRPRNRKMSSRQ